MKKYNNRRKTKNNIKKNNSKQYYSFFGIIFKLILKLIIILAVIYILFAYTNILNENISEDKSIKAYEEILKNDINFAKYTELDVSKDNNKTYKYMSKNITIYNLTDNEIISVKKKEQQLRKEKCVPASITKLFIVKYVVDNLDINSKVTVGNELNILGLYDTRAGIKEGYTYTIDELIKCALLPSGGDAVYTLSKAIINKKENRELSTNIDITRIVKESSEILNEYYKSLGFNDTKITDPTGIREDTNIGVMDILKLSKLLLKDEYIPNITSKHRIRLNNLNGVQYLENTNKFINKQSIFYDKNVIGLKTGTLDDWSNILVLLQYNGKKYLILQTGATSDIQRYNDVYSTIQLIYNGGFNEDNSTKS